MKYACLGSTFDAPLVILKKKRTNRNDNVTIVTTRGTYYLKDAANLWRSGFSQVAELVATAVRKVLLYLFLPLTHTWEGFSSFAGNLIIIRGSAL